MLIILIISAVITFVVILKIHPHVDRIHKKVDEIQKEVEDMDISDRW